MNHSKIWSPLRYPGGKARLSQFLAATIQLNNSVGCQYYEPFAGGAGAALRLLTSGTVDELFLNDADVCIYAFWIAALQETDRFVDRIRHTPLTIEEWYNQKDICIRAKRESIFDIGFAAFYLNRCNRSGILVGAGPIGGYGQKGKWRIDARFNRQNLVSRILQLNQYRDNIRIENMDAISFLSKKLPMGNKRKKAFVYLDPPYFAAGRRLYLNYYKEKDHQALAKYMLRQRVLKWIMSYDNSDFIKQAYHPCKKFLFSLQYSLQKKQTAKELLIAPNHLAIPERNKLKEANIQTSPIEIIQNKELLALQTP